MSGPRVGKCPGCGWDVRVSDKGELVGHSRFTGASLSGAASWDMAMCQWSGKPAPETRPAQLGVVDQLKAFRRPGRGCGS